MLDIEHPPETFALSNSDCPHTRLRPLLSSLAAVREFPEMPQAQSSLLKNPGEESPWSEKEAGFNLFFLNGAPEENLPPPPLSAVPIQLDLLTRSQGGQQKETGLYVRAYDSFTSEVPHVLWESGRAASISQVKSTGTTQHS